MNLRYLAALTVCFGGLAAGQVEAADFGGNCCADLEERIAELEATTARKGNRKVSLTIYGRVNQAVMFWDDGIENNAYVVNNKTATTLVGFEGAASVTPDVSAGYRLEVEFSSANSDFVDQGPVLLNQNGIPIVAVADESNRGVVIRHSNWWLEHKKLGRITVGLQSNAVDNIAEMDLSRTSAVSLSSVETWNEGFFVRDSNTGAVVAAPGVLTFGGGTTAIMGDIFRGNYDGGRGNLVRYDSPLFSGFIVSASWGEDDDWAVALRYAGEFGQFRVRAGIGYHDGDIVDTDSVLAQAAAAGTVLPDRQEIVGSISVLHQPTGLYLTAAAGSREWDAIAPGALASIRDENYFYVKGGLLKNWFQIGQTSIYAEYYRINEFGLEFSPALLADDSAFDEDADMFGVGVVQHIDAAAMALYLAYRRYRADDITSLITAQDSDIEMDVIMAGAQINF